MEDSISPIVISAKPAEKHLETIKAFHNDMITGMKNQSLKVNAYNQQKDLERRDQAMRDEEMQMKMLERADNNQRASDEMAMKTKELSIKEAALNQ